MISWGTGAGEAFSFAAASDFNIVCVGTGHKYEREGLDRETLRLPKVQEEVILQSAARNPNTIVIIFAGGAIDMSAWKDEVKAIVYAGFGGEGMGEALADILMGTVNPSGSSPSLFRPVPRFSMQNTKMHVFPAIGKGWMSGTGTMSHTASPSRFRLVTV